MNSKILVSWVIFESTELMVGVKQTEPDCIDLRKSSRTTGTAFPLNCLGTSLHMKRLNSNILVSWVTFESTELVVGAEQTRSDYTNLRDIYRRNGTAFHLNGLGTSLHMKIL